MARRYTLLIQAMRRIRGFFAELDLSIAQYLQVGWGALMTSLSERLSVEQLAHLSEAITTKIREDGMPLETVQPTLNRLKNIGIVDFGKLRACWLLHDKPYRPIGHDDFGLIADLVLAIGYVERISGSTAIIRREGIVDFSREGRIVASYQLASGRGHRGRAAIEADLSLRLGRASHDGPPHGVLIAGTSDSWDTPSPSSPNDIVAGDSVQSDLISGATTVPMIHVDQLRHNPQLVTEVVP